MTETVQTPTPLAGETRRDFAARLGLAKAGARGRFSKDAVAAIAAAEAAGATFADPKPAPAKPRVAKTAAPAESVAEAAKATPATVNVAPLPVAPAVARAEGRAWGFIGRRKMKDAR